MSIIPMSVVGSPGIDISAACFRPPAGAGLAATITASATTSTDVESDFIRSLPESFLGKHWRHIILRPLMPRAANTVQTFAESAQRLLWLLMPVGAESELFAGSGYPPLRTRPAPAGLCGSPSPNPCGSLQLPPRHCGALLRASS